MGLSYFISFHARFAPGLAPQKPLQSFTHKGFTRKSFQTNKPLHRAAFAHKYLYTQKLVHREARSLYIEQPFTQKLLHADAFTKPFYTENPLHREPVAHRLMMMMEMMEMEVALYDPAFQTELLSASDLHNGPSKAPPRCRPTLEVVLLGLESGASRSWMVYPGAPLQNLTWKGNIYSLRMICSMMFTDIPLFYSMFPSTIGFLIVRLECRRVMPSGKQGCQGPGFSCHEDLHRGQVRVQTSPNSLPCWRHSTPVPTWPRQIPMMKWIDSSNFARETAGDSSVALVHNSKTAGSGNEIWSASANRTKVGDFVKQMSNND